MPRKQNENLIPGYHKLTVEEASRGGKAPRRNKSRAQLAALVSSNPAMAKSKKSLEALGIEDEDMTGDAVIVAGVYARAVKGDIQAVDRWEQWTGSISQNQDGDVIAACAISEQNFYKNIGRSFYSVAGSIYGHEYTHFDLSGGRGSLKSSFGSLIVTRLLMTSQNHDIHALVLRKVSNTLRDSVYAQYLWAIGQLGVAEYWESKVQPMELIFKPTGQKIMFRGADDPMKIKSIKVPFGYIGITHFEEKDQFAGRAEIRTILQSTMRGGSCFWNFETYNPPLSRDNWANKDSLEERSDRLCHKSTYLDVDSEWLGDQFISEAEHLKDTDERAYRHEYLGEAVGTGGNVFDNLELRDITEDEVNSFDRIYQGVDWGYFPDPFAFIRLHYDRARETIYLLDEMYLQKKSNDATAQMITDKGYRDTYITCDSAEPKSVADFRSAGLPAQAAVKGPGSVDYGMKWLARRKIVIDRRRTPNAYKEFVGYEYERNKDGDIISGYPDRDNHLIDATRYALERVYRRYGSKA